MKNIPKPVQVFKVLLEAPVTENVVLAAAPAVKRSLRWPMAAGSLIVLVIVAGAILWLRPWEVREEPASVEDMAFPLPDKPSIAVLPFANMSGDPEQEYFADGMAEDLITDLSKISGLFVISRNSAFTYKGKAVKVRQVAEDLGVRYVLEGSVRRVGDEVRINAQLIDATTGGHLWAERYDGTLADVFGLQDQVVGNIVSALAVQLTDAERKQAARIPTDNLEAYDYYLRGAHKDYSYTWSGLGYAMGFYERAIELDPDFAEAHAGYARVAAEYLRELDGWNQLPADVARSRAYSSVTRALALDPNLPGAHSVLGVLQMLDGNHDEAVESARKAVSLDSNSAEAFANLALVLTYAGRSTEAVPAMKTAVRLDPNPSIGLLYIWGQVLFMNGQYEGALDVLTKVRVARQRNFVGGERLFLAMTLAELGRLDEARSAAEKDMLNRSFSSWMNLTFLRHLWAHHKRKDDLERVLIALRKAGFPEWPSGYDVGGWERLEGGDIEDLLFGHAWFGRDKNTFRTFAQRTNDQGDVVYHLKGHKWDGNVSLEDDRLCYQFPGLLLGRQFCGYLYRNPKGTPEDRNEYVLVDVFDVHYFSVKE
jgi:TolB-like protein/Flp pilus assembly protein TadD